MEMYKILLSLFYNISDYFVGYTCVQFFKRRFFNRRFNYSAL